MFLYPNNHNRTKISKGVEIINPTVLKVSIYITTVTTISRILTTSLISILAGDFDSGAEKDLTNSVTANIAEQVIIITKYTVGKVPGPPTAVTGVLNGSRSAVLNTTSPRTTNAKET